MSNAFPRPWYARPELHQRSHQIVDALTRHQLDWLLDQIGLKDKRPFARRLNAHRLTSTPISQAEHLRLALGELGGAFVKLGQILSTRPDLIPLEYATELAKLQDDATAVPFEQIRQVIFQDFGQQPEAIFAQFDPQPLASASISQAHVATLRTGEEIVVKIQRPGIASVIEQDLEILARIADWAAAHSAIGRIYNLPGLADEFAYTLRNELDFQREGQNTDRFRKNFANDQGVHIPRVYWELTTQHVLALERVSGLKVTDVGQLEAAGINRHALAENVTRLYLRMIFEFGFFHADPHPGNLFVRPDNSIALIDFGMIGRLDDRLKDALLRMGQAVVRNDSARLADELYGLGAAGGGATRNTLERDLSHLLDRYAGGSLKELGSSQITAEVLSVAQRNQLQLPSELALLSRVWSITDGLGISLDPDFRLLEFAKPYLRHFYMERRSPQVLAGRTAHAALDAVELSLTLPERAGRFFTQLEHGNVKLNVDYEGQAELLHEMKRMVNRISLSILLAATIIALGLAVVAYQPATAKYIVDVFLSVAFPLSLVFGVLLMGSIWRSGRK
jgi:ubiquinone biosynthesis protein